MTIVSDYSEDFSDSTSLLPLSDPVDPPFKLQEQVGHLLQREGLALSQVFYWSSTYLTRAMIYPLTPGLYRNLNTPAFELVRRVSTFALHLLLAPLTLMSYGVGGAIRILGEKLSDTPYYFVQGKKQNWSQDHFRALTFNVCMYWGGLPDHGGGLDTANTRMDSLVEILKREKADFLCLQEVSFGPGMDLAHRLKEDYAYLYTNIGTDRYHSTFYSAGPELFFASKVPVLGTPSFIPYRLHSDKIGYFCVETETAWVLCAHFPDGKEEMWPHRRALLEQIHEKMQELEKTTGKRAIFMGDLNVRRTGAEEDEYALSGIQEKFYDPAFKKYPAFNEETATCTNSFLAFRLKEGESPYEIDDYILCSPSWQKEYDLDIRLGLDSYVTDHPEQSVSDHRYYTCDFSKKRDS